MSNIGNQYSIMQSVSSQGSSMSNNENVDVMSKNNINRDRNSKHMGSNGQIYDTLSNNNHRKSSKQRHSAVLKYA
jgi:hypothetical protein